MGQGQIDRSQESIGRGHRLEISDWKGFRDSAGEMSIEQVQQYGQEGSVEENMLGELQDNVVDLNQSKEKGRNNDMNLH